VFAGRHRREGVGHTVEVAFTDRWGGVSDGTYASLDLSRARAGATQELATNKALLAKAFDVEGFVTMHQTHGAEVAQVDRLGSSSPRCDALLTTTPGVALCVTVGDCVPVVLADVDAGVVAVAHAGRLGVVAGVVPATLSSMRVCGAERIEAWLGPHICGGCYEVPAAMRDDVADVVPAAFCCTTWGTPALDIGAAVVAQLVRGGCDRVDESGPCTRESADLFSYRRQGGASGRLGGLVVLRHRAAEGSPG
jgi:YfiH family protein